MPASVSFICYDLVRLARFGTKDSHCICCVIFVNFYVSIFFLFFFFFFIFSPHMLPVRHFLCVFLTIVLYWRYMGDILTEEGEKEMEIGWSRGESEREENL